MGELRKKMAEYFPDTAIPSFTMEINVDVLKSLLNTQNDEKFDEAYQQYRNQNEPDTSAQKQDLKELVKAAVYSGSLTSVKKLVEDGFIFDSESELPDLLNRCCTYGTYDILKYLLSKVGKTDNDIKQINKHPLLSVAIKELYNPDHKDDGSLFKCLNCLLDDERIEIDKPDYKGFTALHYAVKYKDDELVKLLLKRLAYIGTQNMFEEMPICEMSSKVLENYLDSCLSTNNEPPDSDNYEIEIDFSCLVPWKSNENITAKHCADEMLPIKYLSDSSDLKHLLKHPVIYSFVMIKWLKLSRFFYCNLGICTLLIASLDWYVLRWYGTEDSNGKIVLIVVSFICTTYMLVREFFQLVLLKAKYLESLANWVEIALVIASYTVLLESSFENDTKQVISAVVILLSAVEITLLVGSLPFHTFSIYTLMLERVAMNFLKCLLLYSVILISFAFSFHTLFNLSTPKNDQSGSSTATDNSTTETETEYKFNHFSDLFTSLLKTLVMLTGEFEAASIKLDNNIFRCLVFIIFIFCVPIVLFNLINGLAVNDIIAIKNEAELTELSHRVNVVLKYRNALQFIDWKGYLSKQGTFLQPLPENIPLNRVFVRPNTSKYIHRLSNCNDEENNMELRSLCQQSQKNEENMYPLYLSRLDGKILKTAKGILSSRNKKSHYQPFEQQWEKIKKDVDAMLAYSRNLHTK